MQLTRRNLCHNPRFNIWPWGTSGFTGVASTVSFGKTAARWFLQKTNAGTDAVTVSRGTNSTSTAYDKWLRGEPHMEINVSALTVGGNTMKIRQFLEGLEDLGQTMLAMTTICSGPKGSSFYFGAGSQRQKVTFYEDDIESGVPNLVTATGVFAFGDPVYEYLRVTPFEEPSHTGTYRLHHVQLDAIMDPAQIGGIELRSLEEEWRLIERYVMPIQQGQTATGASSTQVRVPMRAPLGAGWRTTPAVATEGAAAALNVTLNSGGTVVANAAPTFSIAANPAANNMGCVVVIGGFTSGTVASASSYVVGPETAPIAYLNADYF